MGTELARGHIQKARAQLDKVQMASWGPADQDWEDAVTWGFYAYENCVVAAAEALNIVWKRVHSDKVKIARRLYRDNVVSRDIGDELERLNELRKDVSYGVPGPDLEDQRS